MYPILNGLLSDKKGGIIFSCFGIWHWCYIIAVFAATVVIFCYLKNKSGDVRKSVTDTLINISFGLYIADFFLMPFAYGEIDMEKLPFHVCTAMCVTCFLSRHNRFLEKYSMQFALLGLISNLIYLVYPAGVMWYQVHPLSYRVVQTLLFHGSMTVYGFAVLAFDDKKLEWKKWYRDLAVIALMTLWAIIGNTLYNGETENYSHSFNWFFVVQDPFYILPQNIAPYVMPILNTVAFFAVDMVVYAVYSGVKKLNSLKEQDNQGI